MKVHKNQLVMEFNGSAMDYIRTANKLKEIEAEPAKTFSKKAFQKFVKSIRDDMKSLDGGIPEYPKAMMNHKQIEKNTATINCGQGGNAEYLSTIIVQHPDFLKLMGESGATWSIETATAWDYSQNPQIRIFYLESSV